MSNLKPVAFRCHEDPPLFVSALRFTAAETGFPARLIEKDYFCSLVLEYLARAESSLVFKGGTCLAKVYADFYRLSEDLDFVIPMPVEATRQDRSRRAAGLKGAVSQLPQAVSDLLVSEPLRGANTSLHYIGALAYRSVLGGGQETIKIEVGLREPLRMGPESCAVRCILLSPISRRTMVTPITSQCIAITEALAEKFRAALSRREVAIRDFFDIDYAVRILGVQPEDAEFVALVRAKLAVPGNGPLNASTARLAALRRQLGPELRPVLRERDFREFDLERAFGIVAGMASRLSEAG